MNRCIFVGATLVMSSVLGIVHAQDSVLAELYGQGVHAYFSGDMRTAHSLLTNAITQGSRDPRCYYYRGLAYSSLGRPTEAEADFRMGAEVEVAHADRIYPVADSLQRVQGRTRLQIERYRQVARLTSHTKASKAQQARYEEMKRSDKDVVRDPGRSPAAAAPPATVATPATADKSDPFAGGAAEPMPEKAPEKPAAAAAQPAAPMDPFGGEAAPATPAAPAATPPAEDAKKDPFQDDPAATPPATPAPAAPATPAPAPPKPADDPFGT